MGREALVRYPLRSPLAQERLKRADGDLIEIAPKRPFSDGTYAVQRDPLSLIGNYQPDPELEALVADNGLLHRRCTPPHPFR